MISAAQIRKIALSLPESFERASYGNCPSWRTKKGMFTWIRTKPDALVVWVDSLDAKEILLEHEPEIFFTTAHYDGYPMLLVRLDNVDAKRARALIEESYRLRAPKPKPRAPARKRSSATKPVKRKTAARKRASR